MASVLHSEEIQPADVDVEMLDDYRLIGFGSGIYYWNHHKSLFDLIEKLPRIHKKPSYFPHEEPAARDEPIAHFERNWKKKASKSWANFRAEDLTPTAV